MIIRRAREVPDIVLIITPSYELGFRRFNSSRIQNEKIYNIAKDVAVTASHVIGDAVIKILSHSVRLAVMKYAQSAECQSTLGKVITLAVNKGIQEGQKAGIEHGKSVRTLAQVEAYDPGVKDDFVSAVTDFENVSFGLLDELESLKDSLLTSIMPALVLKVAQGNVVSTPEVISTARAPAERRGLCPRPVGETSGSTPPHGSCLGIRDLFKFSTLVLSSDGGPTTQPPVTHAYDDLFDTSVLDGTGGI
ncbi:hypothetical protein Tco_1044568 [Tanacetum coccineum]|uniref:Uncharacterized protein n=1 Tax=Tanacetum coccineum TaxID=301880 RepID=A0ABQ5GSU0_9ASTR